MVGQDADRTSRIWLLFPFFGLWILFWLVPLVMGIDLSMQNPDRNAEHWEDASEVGGGSEKQVYSWLSNGPVEEEVKSSSKYVGLGNFEKVLSDAKFYKALKNTALYVFGSIISPRLRPMLNVLI